MILKRMIAAGTLWFMTVAIAHAQLTINTGVHSTVPQIIQGIVNILLLWSGLVTTAVFLGGAIWMVGSGGNEARVTTGKKVMKGALFGLFFILSSWLILSTAVFFIAG